MSKYIVTRYPIRLTSANENLDEIEYGTCDFNGARCYREHVKPHPIDGLHIVVKPRQTAPHTLNDQGFYMYCDDADCETCLNELPF